jgi:hypothetical protein
MVDIHFHNGTDSPKIPASSILRVPQEAITSASGGTLTSGGINDLKTADALILNNAITRIAELETKLQNLGFIK